MQCILIRKKLPKNGWLKTIVQYRIHDFTVNLVARLTFFDIQWIISNNAFESRVLIIFLFEQIVFPVRLKCAFHSMLTEFNVFRAN